MIVINGKLAHLLIFSWLICSCIHRTANNKANERRHHPANDLFIIQHSFSHVLCNFFVGSFFFSRLSLLCFLFLRHWKRGSAYIIFCSLRIFFQNFTPSVIRISVDDTAAQRPLTCKWRTKWANNTSEERRKKKRARSFYFSVSTRAEKFLLKRKQTFSFKQFVFVCAAFQS